MSPVLKKKKATLSYKIKAEHLTISYISLGMKINELAIFLRVKINKNLQGQVSFTIFGGKMFLNFKAKCICGSRQPTFFFFLI